MPLSQEIAEMLDALRRARQELDESISPFLDANLPDLQSLAHLHGMAGRNVRSAKSIEMILMGHTTDKVLQYLLRSELEEAVAYFEGVAAGLAARIDQAARE